MTTNYTPGPWTIGYGGMEGDDYAIVISPHATHAIAELNPQGYCQANAQLIAAAPLLLEALKAVDDGPSKLNARLRYIVKAAIAKAEGQQ